MTITKLPDGHKYYVKKPIPVRAVQMPDRFSVSSMEGTIEGKAGDYLVEGEFGELYPCDRVIFEATYRKVKIPEKAAAEAKACEIESMMRTSYPSF